MCEQECCTQEEYENAVNCGNCAETPCYPPECKLCFPPSAAPCYRPQQTSYEPGITTCDPCNPCVERCNSCQTLGPYPMPLEDNPYQPRLPCPPLETCSPVCSPYRRYIQPKRRESCKPIVHYQRPMVPMPDDTVYRQSFDYIDAQTMASCRQRPVLPIGQLAKSCGEISDETVTRVRLDFHHF